MHRRKIRSRLPLAERKPNTMQPIHSIFFIAALRAARQCFPTQTTAIHHEETRVSRKRSHYLCYEKEAARRMAKR